MTFFLPFSIVNCLLPIYRLCSIEFLQQILSERKKVLSRKATKTRSLPSFSEFSVPVLISKCLKKDHLKMYFPDHVEHVDRSFAWSVYETLEPEAAEKYF